MAAKLTAKSKPKAKAKKKPAARKPETREMVRRANGLLCVVEELPKVMKGDEPRFEATAVVGGHVIGTYTSEQLAAEFQDPP